MWWCFNLWIGEGEYDRTVIMKPQLWQGVYTHSSSSVVYCNSLLSFPLVTPTNLLLFVLYLFFNLLFCCFSCVISCYIFVVIEIWWLSGSEVVYFRSVDCDMICLNFWSDHLPIVLSLFEAVFTGYLLFRLTLLIWEKRFLWFRFCKEFINYLCSVLLKNLSFFWEYIP